MTYPNFSAYLRLSQLLTAKPSRGGGNMFRHQMETLAILLEYGYDELVLLEATLICNFKENGNSILYESLKIKKA